ncbi:MAG: hypothetical protein J6P72_01270 [Firmicutes bacterium]|nr:hypothetical protein [Bacillota bacterium]
MIILTKIRLINWYAFSYITAPIGQFTLIAGKNGNGKSVLLDAIKYAAYGDTAFNKASEGSAGSGARTLSSYTRGLLDATAGTYIRPADRYPNIITHIALEYSDPVEGKVFVLGTCIETNASNNYRVLRYVADGRVLDEIDHVRQDKDGGLIPLDSRELSRRYHLTMMERSQALPKFLQLTGLRLGLPQLPTYLRKLRGILSYNPSVRIDQFIRESVLEKKDIDFGKLIEAKSNIEQLNQSFDLIQAELNELDGILKKYDELEQNVINLRADDIRQVYKTSRDLKERIEHNRLELEAATRTENTLEKKIAALEKNRQEISSRLIKARTSLESLDSARLILAQEEKLVSLRREEADVRGDCEALELFQRKVSEILHRILSGKREVPQKEVLASLCSSRYTSEEKESAVSLLKQLLDEIYDEAVSRMALLTQEIAQIEVRMSRQEKIIEDCRRHRTNYSQIPDYVGLKNDIDRELERRGRTERARFACEYVLSLKDEAWRDALESFLGARRYTILVDPQVYDIADEVLNRSEHRYAHLFNTRLLMKREVKVEEDSAVHLLEIRSEVAKKYFDYQLGRMHAVPLSEVKRFENAISKEGRVSVAMDSYFLRFDRTTTYYLGQRIYELNQKKAEKEYSRLTSEREEMLKEKKALSENRAQINLDRPFFKDYQFDAHEKAQTVMAAISETEKELKALKKAQAKNREFLELSAAVERLEVEQQAAEEDFRDAVQDHLRLEEAIRQYNQSIQDDEAAQNQSDASLNEFRISDFDLTNRVVEAYEKYVKSGSVGTGGLLLPQSRQRLKNRIDQLKTELTSLQAQYKSKHPASELPVGDEGRNFYAQRHDKIWMDDLEEIRSKLRSQTRRYEEIFKNEFVLTILKSCEKAREDLRGINRELARLQFAARYQFDVHYLKDGSDYAKVLDYARYVDERERLGAMHDADQSQVMLDDYSDFSSEEAEKMEREIQQILSRLIDKGSEEAIARFADYRNYMNYEILISNEVLDRAKLSRQTGYNSGAEVQIPYLLILTSALLMIYNQRSNSTRLVFIDEPFAKMDPGNVRLMLDFLRSQDLQVIFCAPDKTESIGEACDVILPVLRTSPDQMLLGIVQFK